MDLGHFKCARSPNHSLDRVGTRPGSNRSEIVGPNKGLGRKNKALTKDLIRPVIKELLSVGRDN